MIKQQHLIKMLVRQGVVAVVVLIVCGGVWFGIGTQVESNTEEKTKADNAANAVQGQIASLQSQLDKSGNAEKGFAQLSAMRTSMNFEANSEAFKEFLRQAKKTYRFSSNFKLSVSQEKITNPPGVASLNYDINVRPGMKLDLEAMSDYHVLSFLDALERSAPGLIKVNALKLKRRGDITPAVVTDMQRGVAPILVEATIDFSWIGVDPKPEKAPPPTAKPGK